MSHLDITRRNFMQASLAAGVVGSWGIPSFAVPISPIERRIPAQASAEERLRQPDIWVMDVYVKPLRMIEVELPDPKSGEVKPRVIWYLCYRAVNRPIEVKSPPNELPPSDKKLATQTQIFVPEFQLVARDNQQQKRYFDRVMPVAQQAINRREKVKYLNSVEIVGPVPTPVPEGQSGKELLGVATWRGIDPTIDRFRLFMTGFSNGYEVGQVDAGQTKKEVVLRKTLQIDYWRPGDEFELMEREIRMIESDASMDDEAEQAPRWRYR